MPVSTLWSIAFLFITYIWLLVFWGLKDRREYAVKLGIVIYTTAIWAMFYFAALHYAFWFFNPYSIIGLGISVVIAMLLYYNGQLAFLDHLVILMGNLSFLIIA